MDKKICSFCKAELSEDEKVCHVCGADVSSSAKAEKRICASCGAELDQTQKFCYKCGTKWVAPEAKQTVCSECGAAVPDNAEFCGECGARLAVDGKTEASPVEDGACATVFADKLPEEVKTALNVESAPDVPKKKRSFTVLELVKRSLVLLIALLTFGLAFAPVCRVELDLGSDMREVIDDDDLKLSALDLICLPFAAAKSYGEEELIDLELYERVEELGEEFSLTILRGDEYDDFDEFLHLTIRLALQTDEIDASASMIFTAVTAFIYIAFATVFLVFAALWFAGVFRGKTSFSVALKLLAATPIYTLAFLVSNAVGGMRGAAEMEGMEAALKLSAAPVLSIVFAFAVLAFVAVLRLCFEEKPKVRVGSIIKRSIACALALVLMLLPLAPVFTSSVKTVFSGKDKATEASTTLGADFFSSVEISEKETEERGEFEVEDVDASIESYYNNISKESKRVFEKGKSSANQLLAKELLIGYGGYSYTSVFALGTISYMLVVFCAAALLWVNLAAVATGFAPKRYVTIPLKVLAIAFTVGTLVLAIVVCSVIKTNVAEFKEMRYWFKLNGGIITTLVFAAITAGAPMVWKSPKSEEAQD